jgi:hypothetical protein
MADLLHELDERIKAIGGDWTKYTVVGTFALYVAGYLALRFHLTAIGVWTDLAVLDERYVFTGARFLVYAVATIPSIVFLALPGVAVAWAVHRLLPEAARARARAWLLQPMRLIVIGVLFAVCMIQFVMRQCFYFSNLLLARSLPEEPAWLARLLLDDRLMPLYFSGLVAACIVSLVLLWLLRGLPVQSRADAFGRMLLAVLAGVQILLLPVNFGILIVDKTFARVAALGERKLDAGEIAWLVWEGKDGTTFLVRDQAHKRRSLVTLPRTEVKQTEIVGFDRIVPLLFLREQGAKE